MLHLIAMWVPSFRSSGGYLLQSQQMPDEADQWRPRPLLQLKPVRILVWNDSQLWEKSWIFTQQILNFDKGSTWFFTSSWRFFIFTFLACWLADKTTNTVHGRHVRHKLIVPIIHIVFMVHIIPIVHMVSWSLWNGTHGSPWYTTLLHKSPVSFAHLHIYFRVKKAMSEPDDLR